MHLNRVLLLFVVAVFALNANRAQALSFDLNFAAPGPDCPVEDAGCADLVDVVPVGPPVIGVPPTGAPFLSYAIGGGNLITGAAWAAFDGTIDLEDPDTPLVLGQMRQDIDLSDGGLGVDENTDNIDAGESVALFANGGLNAFTLSSVALGNHPNADFDEGDLFELWWTNDATFAMWEAKAVAFAELADFLDEIGEVFAVAFEALPENSTFYLSGAAGDVITPIPEPTTALLIGLGLSGLAARRRRPLPAVSRPTGLGALGSEPRRFSGPRAPVVTRGCRSRR